MQDMSDATSGVLWCERVFIKCVFGVVSTITARNLDGLLPVLVCLLSVGVTRSQMLIALVVTVLGLVGLNKPLSKKRPIGYATVIIQ